MNGYVDLHHPAIIDAIPIPIFLVDGDVRILDLNAAASASFGLLKETICFQRGGDALHCLHSQDVPEGCGRAPACETCAIRNSVSTSAKGRSATRWRMKFEMRMETQKTPLELLISASPFPHAGGTLVLLTVEDIRELSRLRAIIPICSYCKKIRNETKLWQQVEVYFHDYLGVNFSHGICPDCLKQFYLEYIGKRVGG